MHGKKRVSVIHKEVTWVVAVIASFLLAGSQVTATNIFSFNRITNNNVEDVASQLTIEVVDIGNDQVRFDIRNDVDLGTASNVAEVYFDDNASVLMSPVVQVINNGTNFTGGGANPGNLPGGKAINPRFLADTGLSADTDSGNPDNGINTSTDVLGMVFDIVGGKNFGDVIAALNSQSLRAGLHVRSIGVASGSDSFVSGDPIPPGNPVPEPTSIALMGLGLAAVGMRYRRKRQNNRKTS